MKNLTLILLVTLLSFSMNSKAQTPGPFSDPYPPMVFIFSNLDNTVIDLPARSIENNKAIKSYKYNGNVNQWWLIHKQKNGFVLLAPYSHMVLTVDENDSVLVQRNFNKEKSQYWEITKTNGIFQIYNKKTKLYLTNVGAEKPIELKEKNDLNNQEWVMLEPWNRKILTLISK